MPAAHLQRAEFVGTLCLPIACIRLTRGAQRDALRAQHLGVRVRLVVCGNREEAAA